MTDREIGITVAAIFIFNVGIKLIAYLDNLTCVRENKNYSP